MHPDPFPEEARRSSTATQRPRRFLIRPDRRPMSALFLSTLHDNPLYHESEADASRRVRCSFLGLSSLSAYNKPQSSSQGRVLLQITLDSESQHGQIMRGSAQVQERLAQCNELVGKPPIGATHQNTIDMASTFYHFFGWVPQLRDIR